ncbi:hypothetical protein SDC9_129764 [bioreactor metagenome]|uniref:Uncharacterized protein n=1 Tax=bioreactor metagenome TaxID=1076179 RepID=A0A645D1V2_9ZZZZ
MPRLRRMGNAGGRVGTKRFFVKNYRYALVRKRKKPTLIASRDKGGTGTPHRHERRGIKPRTGRWIGAGLIGADRGGTGNWKIHTRIANHSEAIGDKNPIRLGRGECTAAETESRPHRY